LGGGALSVSRAQTSQEKIVTQNNLWEIKSLGSLLKAQIRRLIILSFVFMAFITVSCSGGSSDNLIAIDATVTPSPQLTLTGAQTKTSTVIVPPDDTLMPTPTNAHEATPSALPEPTTGLLRISEENATQIEPFLTLSGHNAPVIVVEYSPDGSLIASGSEDATVRIWNSSDGSLVHELIGHLEIVNDLSFSPDGTILASASNDGSIRFWDVDDGNLIRTIDPLIDRVYNVEFSPDGNLLAISGQNCFIELRHVNSGIFRRSLPQPKCVERYQGMVSSWGIDFTSDGEEIITGDGRPCCGGSIQRWEVGEYVPPTLLEGYQLRTRDLDISPDDSTLTAAFIGSSVFWLMDAENGSLLETFTGHTYRVNSVVFSPDGEMIASGSRDKTIGLWNLDGALIHRLETHTDAINSIAFSPNGEALASASDDKTVILWRVILDAN
jgi:WD40 repeat protein